METEHLNDNLGQEASEFIARQKELRNWLMEKLNAQGVIGGWINYNKPRKERLWQYIRRQYGKRSNNSG